MSFFTKVDKVVMISPSLHCHSTSYGIIMTCGGLITIDGVIRRRWDHLKGRSGFSQTYRRSPINVEEEGEVAQRRRLQDVWLPREERGQSSRNGWWALDERTSPRCRTKGLPSPKKRFWQTADEAYHREDSVGTGFDLTKGLLVVTSLSVRTRVLHF